MNKSYTVPDPGQWEKREHSSGKVERLYREDMHQYPHPYGDVTLTYFHFLVSRNVELLLECRDPAISLHGSHLFRGIL